MRQSAGEETAAAQRSWGLWPDTGGSHAGRSGHCQPGVRSASRLPSGIRSRLAVAPCNPNKTTPVSTAAWVADLQWVWFALV